MGSPDSCFGSRPPSPNGRALLSTQHAAPPSTQHTLAQLGLGTPSVAAMTPPNLRQTSSAQARQAGALQLPRHEEPSGAATVVEALQSQSRARLQSLRAPSPPLLRDRCALHF